MVLPGTTMMGALVHYITQVESKAFQPVKAMFGLLPQLDEDTRYPKRVRFQKYAQRAIDELDHYLNTEMYSIRDSSSSG